MSMRITEFYRGRRLKMSPKFSKQIDMRKDELRKYDLAFSLKEPYIIVYWNSVHYYREHYMLKNITLSAEEDLIKKAREKAQKESTTLNATFRRWLKIYVASDLNALDYEALMKSMNYVKPGKKFTRIESMKNEIISMSDIIATLDWWSGKSQCQTGWKHYKGSTSE